MQDLHLPGPCPLPPSVSHAVGGAMINPRGPEFAQLLADCTEPLRRWLQTDHEILFMAASGTGALEGVVANLLSPGEPALFCTMGWFGELWARIATALGADVRRLDVPWGQAISPEALEAALDCRPSVRTVFLTHSETSTGVRNDLTALASVVKARGKLLAIDAISGAPCHRLAIDDLGADVVALASQKGWLAPPGLAMVVVSPAALAAAAQGGCGRYYFDFTAQQAQQAHGRTHTTPPLPAMYGLRTGLSILEREGREAVWARHQGVAALVRARATALGLTLFAQDTPSNTVTVIRSPFACPSELAAFLERLRSHYGSVLADGVGPMQGQAFRIGHLGATGYDDVIRLMARVQAALADVRAGVDLAAA